MYWATRSKILYFIQKAGQQSLLAGSFCVKLCERQRIFYGSRYRLSLIDECSRKGGLIMGQGKNNRKKRDGQAENGNGQVRQQDDEAKKLEKEIEEKEDNKLEEYGQVILEDNRRQRKIHLITIIGEVEGHENSSGSSKTTKYDHILPKLAEIEDDDSVDGLLVLLNTSGGDVDAGLAIAEMIASLSLPSLLSPPLFFCVGRKPLHRGSPGRVHKLFLHCAVRHHDDPSGADDGDGYRHIPDL